MTQLQKGPVAIGLQAENEMFYSYASGILRSENCAKDADMDHSAVVVAYVDA